MAMEKIQSDRNIIFEDMGLVMEQAMDRLNDSMRQLTRQGPHGGFEKLQSTIYKIKAPAIHREPPLEKKIGEWNSFLAGDIKTLNKGVIRYLCWMPDIALDVRFLTCLVESGVDLNRRCLAGLVSSCHNRWETLPEDSQSLRIIRGLVKHYRGSDKALMNWQAHTDAILGARGPRTLAERFVREEVPLRSFIRTWRLEPQSPFVGQFVEIASTLCRTKIPRITRGLMLILFRDLLSWPGWKPQTLKKEVGALVLHRPLPGEVQDIIQRFVLHHRELGDPRLSVNRVKWLQVPQEARERFLQWLNREIPFAFTDHVYRQGAGWSWQQRTSATEPLSFNEDDWK